MQIKIQSKRIQCLKPVRDEEKKRTKGVLVLSFPSHLDFDGIDKADLKKANLSVEELDQLKKFLIDHRFTKTVEGNAEIVQSVPGALATAATTIGSWPQLIDATLANEIFKSMEVLKISLKKAGYKPQK